MVYSNSQQWAELNENVARQKNIGVYFNNNDIHICLTFILGHDLISLSVVVLHIHKHVVCHAGARARAAAAECSLLDSIPTVILYFLHPVY